MDFHFVVLIIIFQSLHVKMERFVCPLMVPALTKVVWRYAIRMCGVLSLMSRIGVSMMPPLPVLNLDLTEMVSVTTVTMHDACMVLIIGITLFGIPHI